MCFTDCIFDSTFSKLSLVWTIIIILTIAGIYIDFFLTWPFNILFPETMSINDPMAAAAQRYKPIQSAVPGTTLGPIQINAFLGGGV